jgi:peptide/nickel transport system permease protein
MRRPPRTGRRLIRFRKRSTTGVIGPGQAEFQAAMGSASVVVGLVLGHHDAQVSFAEDQHPVGQLSKVGITWFQPGYYPITQSPVTWLGRMILPWITLATVQVAVYSRLTRGSLLDALGEDYIRTARAKGLSERRVIYRHGLRSALIPVTTQLGVDVATLISGAVVTETVFNLGGVGQSTVQAVVRGDLFFILAVVILTAVAVVVANIVVDAAYSFLDPRVRLY